MRFGWMGGGRGFRKGEEFSASGSVHLHSPETSVASQPNRLDVRAIVLFANFAVDVDPNTRGIYSEFPPAV